MSRLKENVNNFAGQSLEYRCSRARATVTNIILTNAKECTFDPEWGIFDRAPALDGTPALILIEARTAFGNREFASLEQIARKRSFSFFVFPLFFIAVFVLQDKIEIYSWIGRIEEREGEEKRLVIRLLRGR